MSDFDAKFLDSDPDGLALLAAVLHPTKQARVEAIARGRERLGEGRSIGRRGGVKSVQAGGLPGRSVGARTPSRITRSAS